MAAPSLSTTLEAHLPVVTFNGLNTLKAVNFSNTQVDTSGNVSVAGTLSVTGATTQTGAFTPTGGVAAAGGFTATPRVIATGGIPVVATTDGTNLDIVTTETYITEVFIPCNTTITGIAVFNGTAVAGNLTVGLATSAGAPIAAAKSASTAASGTTAYQRIDFATPYAAVGPATYYVMVQGNNTGGDLRTHTVGNFDAQKQTAQTYGTFATITVAGTFTTGVGVMSSLY